MINDNTKLGIYSKKNILTDKLKFKFNNKYLDVNVFEDLKEVEINTFNYLIISLLNKDAEITNIINLVSKLNCKILVLYPLFVRQDEKYIADSNINSLLEANKNLGIVLVPELLADGVVYNPEYVSHDLIMQSVISERIKIKDSVQLINTISISQLVEVVVKEIFSFGIAGQALALIGPRVSPKKFLVDFLGIDEKNVVNTKGESSLVEVINTSSIKVDFSIKLAARSTRNTFLNNLKKGFLIPNKDISHTKSIKNNFFKNLIYLVCSIIILFLMPLFGLLISLSLFYLSTRYIASNINRTENLLNYSIKTVKMSQTISFGLPVYYDYSNIIFKSNSLFKEMVELSKVCNDLVSKILGKESYDLSYYSDNISAILDKIYTDIGFLQSDINELDDFVGRKVKLYLSKSSLDINKYKNKVYFIKNLASRLNVLLGFEKPMKYLVLFQNNMELRPTGGFIGSFALITVDGGKLTEIVVNDVYSADGQLKGHVEPPEPIRKYLGEGGWYMRDANWDPNFPDSALKIEWFLDKEINTKVDGVIAIDLFLVQNLLKISGPLNLTDFNKTITSDNLYNNIQNEVESDFFPGSIKKQSFLTALSKQLIIEIQSIDRKKYFAFLKEIYKSLEERHMQLYFHDANTQKAISNLGYSGEINLSTNCGPRCFRDSYTLIDANLGVNKSNYFVERKQEVNMIVSRHQINHELFVTYTNSASASIGNLGTYKNYVRILIPKEASFEEVGLFNGVNSYDSIEFDKTIINDRQEIGFLITVLPGDYKRVQIVWNETSDSLLNGGEYNLFVKKQPGTSDDSLLVNFLKGDLLLTGGVPSVYTTSLREDFSLKTFFKQ